MNKSDLTDVFVYVHWSKDLTPTVGEINLLKQTKSQGLQNLIVLNVDSLEVARKSERAWGELTENLILRKNRGRDLAAYRAAISLLNPSQVTRIFFFNNSVFWLPLKMKDFVKKFINIDEEIYSATISYQPIKHMQSFAIAAKRQGVEKLLDEIFKIRNTRSKRATIAFGEIRISRNLTRRGINFSNGCYEYSSLIKQALTHTNLLSQPKKVINPAIDSRLVTIREAIANGVPLNPTHHTWFELYNLGFPGIKRDLLSKNPSRIPDLMIINEYFEETDKKLINFETVGFLTSRESFVDRARRLLGV